MPTRGAVAVGGGPPVVALVGPSGSGKTTLLERLIGEFLRAGLRVGAIKHAPHGFDLDRPGKDTWRFREAGAAAVAAAAPGAVGVFRTWAGEPPLDEVVRLLGDVDLVLVEGYGARAPLCVEVRGEPAAAGAGPAGRSRAGCGTVVAVAVAEAAEAATTSAEPEAAVFHRDDAAGIAAAILGAVRAGGGRR